MPPKELKIALAYEGELDKEPIIKLVDKILSPHAYNYSIVRTVTPKKGIIGSIPLYLKIFFKVEVVDIALFVTDQDVSRDKDPRRTHIKKIIKEANPTYLDFSAVGVCEPHFEAWLIADQDNVKKIFNLPSIEALPFIDDLSPKGIIEKMHRDMDIPKPTLHEIYYRLADGLDIEALKSKAPDFNLFYSELINASKLVYSR